MTASGHNSLPCIGFLTVVDDAEVGLTGGYLVLNTLGRPLEFHCTAPVKTNRTQEILYGPTLKSFLYGEQIGQTLWEKSQLNPLLVCTDVEPALAIRDVITTPVAWVASKALSSSALPATQGAFVLGRHHFHVSPRHGADQQRIVEVWRDYADEFDLAEPFERIRDAISEAQKAA